jgi:hypothetical protein
MDSHAVMNTSTTIALASAKSRPRREGRRG